MLLCKLIFSFYILILSLIAIFIQKHARMLLARNEVSRRRQFLAWYSLKSERQCATISLYLILVAFVGVAECVTIIYGNILESTLQPNASHWLYMIRVGMMLDEAQSHFWLASCFITIALDIFFCQPIILMLRVSSRGWARSHDKYVCGTNYVLCDTKRMQILCYK